MYENFVGTWETVRNREVSVLERCPHGEVRLYFKLLKIPNGLYSEEMPLALNCFLSRINTD